MKSFYHSNESFASQSRPKYGSFTSRLREISSHLTLLLLILTVFSGNVWGGNEAGFFSDGAAQVTFTINGRNVSVGMDNDDFSEYDLGTAQTLTLKSAWAKTWKTGSGNVCGVDMYYKVATDKPNTTSMTKAELRTFNDLGSGDQEISGTIGKNLLTSLTAGTTYYITINFDLYGNNGGNSGCYTGNGTLDNNGSQYIFKFKVADSKDKFAKDRYIYLDARNQTNWQSSDFSARFYFKRYDTEVDIENKTCDNTNKLEGWVYYVKVTNSNSGNHNYNGKVEVDRVNPSDNAEHWCHSPIMSAAARDDDKQNCIGGAGSVCEGWTPTWTTYCPPMDESTLEDNGTTTLWGGDGSVGTPYLIPTNSTIKLSSSSESALDDENMTQYYQFKDGASEVQAGSATVTCDYTASSTTATTHKMVVDAYNYYNSTSGTHLASDTIYYQTRTPYEISYNAGENGSGERDAEIKLRDVTFTLPSSAVFTRTGYNQTGWTTSEGGSQTHTLGGGYTTNDDQEFFPVWTPKSCTVTFDKNSGSDGSNSATATYDSALPDITPPTRANYTFDGYWSSETDNDGSGTQYYDAEGHSVTNWNVDTEEETTLYAKWLPIYTVTWSVNGSEWTSGTPSTAVTSGLKVSTLPTAPTTVDCDDLKKFVGWTTDDDYSGDEAPEDLFSDIAGSPTITDDIIFYAVFANQVGPNVNTVLWSEDWTGESANAMPGHPTAGGSTVYGVTKASIDYKYSDGTGTNESGATKVYIESTGGGTAPELMVHGNETTPGYFKIEGIPSGGADSLTLSFKRNNYTLTPSVSGDGYILSSKISGTGKDTYVYYIKCGSGATFDLTFTGPQSKTNNVRLDDIVLKVKTNNASGFVTTCAACTAPPTVVAPDTSDVTCSGVTVAASISSLGTCDGCHIRNYGFVWGTNTTPTLETHTNGDVYTVNENIDEGEEFSYDITGLSSATRYYVRTYAQNKNGVAYSDAINFYTKGAWYISVYTRPRTNYIAGEKIDTTGMVVRAYYPNTSSYKVITKECDYDPDLSTPLEEGATTWTISYEDECGASIEPNTSITFNAYTLTVEEGENDEYGSFTTNVDTIRVTLNTNKAFDFAISETAGVPDAEIINIGEKIYRVVNPKHNVTVTINYRNASKKKVYFKVNNDTLKTLTQEVYEFKKQSSLPSASEVATAMSADGVALIAESYPNFVGWVSTPFYGQATPPDFDESVYVTQDTALYAVFSNMQRIHIDERVITSGSYPASETTLEVGGKNFIYHQICKNSDDLRFRQRKADVDSGYIYNSSSLEKIRRVEIGAGHTGNDDVHVFACSAEGTKTGDALVDAETSIHKYSYVLPSKTSYFIVHGDDKRTYYADYIDIYYSTSSVPEAYICRPRRTTPSGFWKDASHWSGGELPGASDVVYIEHSTGTYSSLTPTHAHVAAVVIRSDSAKSRLYIEPNSSLIVESSIRTFDGSEFGPTPKDKLQINTDYRGNGGLIVGTASANTEAYYSFYSKIYRYGSYYINQYVGIPFASMSPYQWYGINVFEYDPSRDDWMTPDNADLKPFTCYNIISKTSGISYTEFYTNGTLNLPGTSGTKVLSCGWREPEDFEEGEFPESIDGEEGHQDFMFANSWTAPISVEDLTSDDCTNLLEEVHIFNAGWTNPSEDAKKEIGNNAGQWTCISFQAAGYLTDSVIPATQAFLVTATAEGASLTLDYGKHVYEPAIRAGRISTAPTRAPRRSKASNAPIKLKMMVRSDSVIADNIYLFQREDFTYEYDNGWDGTKIMGESFAPQLYAMSGERKLTIDAVPEMDETEIGFKAGTQANEYTFSFEYDEQEEPLYLYDKDTQEFTEITNESTYSFTTSDRKEHARFLLTRSNVPQSPTGVEEVENETVQRAEKFMKDQQIFIRRGERTYSIDGSLVK